MNRSLAKFSTVIPYIKELRPFAKSVLSTILMRQLDYWFDIYNGETFYKFTEPVEEKNEIAPSKKESKYKKGDSWTEELSISYEEFVTAFDNIGVRYKSKTQYLKALENDELFIDEEGNEKYYCSYHDKLDKVTYYIRNHTLVDDLLADISSGVEMRKPKSTSSRNRKVRIPQSAKAGVDIHETTTETTTETTNYKNMSAFADATAETVETFVTDIVQDNNTDHISILEKENGSLALVKTPSPVPLPPSPSNSIQKLENVTIEQTEQIRAIMKSVPQQGKNPYFNEWKLNAKRFTLVLAYRLEKGHITIDKIVNCVRVWETMESFSIGNFLHNLIGEKYSINEVFKDLITILTDNKVVSWSRENKGIKLLKSWIEDTATTLEEIEDCLLWMMDTKNKMDFSLSLDSVPKALTHFQKVKVLRPDGRYEANFVQNMSRTEKDYKLLKERDYEQMAKEIVGRQDIEKDSFI